MADLVRVGSVTGLLLDRLPSTWWRAGNTRLGGRVHFCFGRCHVRTVQWKGRVVAEAIAAREEELISHGGAAHAFTGVVEDREPWAGAASLDTVVSGRQPLAPFSEAVVCACGALLLDPSWRGRATVRCSRCGSKWGVEVTGTDGSTWALT